MLGGRDVVVNCGEAEKGAGHSERLPKQADLIFFMFSSFWLI